MSTLARDTSPAAEAILIELWRQRTTAQKLSSIVTMCQTARELVLSDLRKRHPDANRNELDRLLLVRMAGEETARLVLLRRQTSSSREGKMQNELQVLHLVTRRLEELKLPYFVSGSVASIKYGEPRFTRDADIVIRMLPAHVAEFVQKFEADFVVSTDAVRDAIHAHFPFQLIHIATAFKIDLYPVTESDEMEIMAFARRQRHNIGEGEVLHSHSQESFQTIAQMSYFKEKRRTREDSYRMTPILEVAHLNERPGYPWNASAKNCQPDSRSEVNLCSSPPRPTAS
jgi:hypothetical protein